jgi:Ca2+-transporting ATPase
MRRHRVLIRHLEAVETLGCVQTICLDKTGTLTRNQMTLVAVHAGLSRFSIENHVLRRVETFTGLDTLSPTQGPSAEKIDPYGCDELLKILQVTVLCSESQVAGEKGTYVVTGTPTENALVQAALGFGVDVPNLRETHPLQKLFHRSENRNLMVSIHGHNGSGGVIAVKGSPREVLALCRSYWKDGKMNPFSEEERLYIENENDRMAEEGLRILGVAYGVADDPAVLVNGNVETILSETLVWVGLVGLADPLRGGVREVIHSFHLAGIDTVMITGDQSPTAYAIGRALNLSNSSNLEIMDSTHIADMDREIMKALSQRVQIFSRVSPAHKLQIVQALQGSGKIVAMTGDGINDGPALKAANIGVAMGHTGTDVAREVADVVLEDDNLETMIVAISQGRTIYNNIRKSLHYLLSTNMSEIILMSGAMGAGLGQPLNTIQLLWINLMSDVFPALALSLEQPEPDILSRPPRDPGEPIIRRDHFKRIFFESGTLAAGGIGAYLWGLARYGQGAQAGTLAFLSLTTGQILHALSCRSNRSTIFDFRKRPANPYLQTAVGGSLLVQALALFVPGLRNLLGLGPLAAADYAVALGGALLPLVVNETTKKVWRGREAANGSGRQGADADSEIPLLPGEIFPQR